MFFLYHLEFLYDHKCLARSICILNKDISILHSSFLKTWSVLKPAYKMLMRKKYRMRYYAMWTLVPCSKNGNGLIRVTWKVEQYVDTP